MCRRVSSPWNNRPVHFVLTWRDWGIRRDRQGPELIVTGPIHAQSFHKLPHNSMKAQVLCHRCPVTQRLRPRAPPQWMQTRTQKQRLLCHFVNGLLCSSPPLSDVCVNQGEGSEISHCSFGNICSNVDHLLVATKLCIYCLLLICNASQLKLLFLIKSFHNKFLSFVILHTRGHTITS